MRVGDAGEADLPQPAVAELADDGHGQPADPPACARSRSQPSPLADDAVIVTTVLRSTPRRAGRDAVRKHRPGADKGLRRVRPSDRAGAAYGIRRGQTHGVLILVHRQIGRRDRASLRYSRSC
jgi:hypothetical protein